MTIEQEKVNELRYQSRIGGTDGFHIGLGLAILAGSIESSVDKVLKYLKEKGKNNASTTKR